MASEGVLYVGYTVSHNASVAVMDEGGHVLEALSEERLSRVKLHAGYPWRSMQQIREKYGDRKWVVCFARLGSFQRILRTIRFQTLSWLRGRRATPLKPFVEKLVYQLTKEQKTNGKGGGSDKPPVDHFVDHHTCHAASAYYHSGFPEAAVMTLDGLGNYFSCTFSDGNHGNLVRQRAYFHNDVTIGNDYEVVTGMLGFNPLRHPGKITGLAAYGKFNEACIETLSNFLKNNWNGREIGFFLKYFEGQQDDSPKKRRGLELLRKIRTERFRVFSSEDIAYAIQEITERKTQELIRRHIPNPAGRNLALAGGVFANVKLNQRIKELGFANLFIQPAMDDGGLALGAPLSILGERGLLRPYAVPTMLLGPSYDGNDRIRDLLDRAGLAYKEYDAVEEKIAELIAQGKVVARFNGRMEFGPRALGNRSILYQATDPKVNDWLNKRLGRTEFMPFAPVTLWEEADRCYLNMDGIRHTAKFMTITVNCTDWARRTTPAVVHVDGTARPQLIQESDNPSYYKIVKEYSRLTGIPTLVNTSFNMHEEPIVATPEDAIRAFVQGHLDCLAMNNFIVTQRL